jgi:hypothetical protein
METERGVMDNTVTGQIRFYSLPPRHIYYPYLLANIWNWKELDRRQFEHAILDSGVEVFRVRKWLKDYPPSLLLRYSQKAEIVTHKFKDKVWVTIPDYPDDLSPGQFGNNVEKTLQNIERFISIDGVEWLPVLQSRYLNLLSFYEACERTRKLIGNYPRIAIGTVCKTRKHAFIIECCRIARKFFPKSWIHAFGLTLDVLPRVKFFINSFDSLACYYPRKSFKEWSKETGLKPFPNQSSMTKAKVSEIFFKAYLERLRQILSE